MPYLSIKMSVRPLRRTLRAVFKPWPAVRAGLEPISGSGDRSFASYLAPLLSYTAYDYQIEDRPRVKIKEIGIRKVLGADTAGLAAILSQTIRASLANPVDSLKHEE